MPYINEKNITPREFINECGLLELYDIASLLEDMGILDEEGEKKVPSSISEAMFNEHLQALKNSWPMLSVEDEKIIMEIAKKFMYF